MNIFHAISGILALALAFTTYHASTQRAALRSEVTVLREDIAGNAEELRENAEDLRSRLDALAKRPPYDIAAALVDRHKESLTELLVEQIGKDEAMMERLRGEPGQAADPELVANAIVNFDPEFATRVADVIWRDRREELTLDDTVIATIAEAVYSKYQNELRGPQGISPEAEAIAAALAWDPNFLMLIKHGLSAEE